MVQKKRAAPESVNYQYIGTIIFFNNILDPSKNCLLCYLSTYFVSGLIIPLINTLPAFLVQEQAANVSPIDNCNHYPFQRRSTCTTLVLIQLSFVFLYGRIRTAKELLTQISKMFTE